MTIVGKIVGKMVNELSYVAKGSKYLMTHSETVGTIKKGAKYLKNSIFGLSPKYDGSVVRYSIKGEPPTLRLLRPSAERCNVAADYMLQRHPSEFVSPTEVAEHLTKLRKELSSMPLASIEAREIQADIAKNEQVLALLSN